MYRYAKTVSQESHGIKLKLFLKSAWAFLPDGAVEKALRARDVKINGKRAAADAVLSLGDTVEIYTVSALCEPPILYDDENLCIINKPAGVSSDSTYPDEESIQTWASERFPGARICHRLDNQTSGLMLIAKNKPAYDEIRCLLKERRIEKTYECLVFGCPSPREAILTAWLIKDARAGKVSVRRTQQEGALHIITEYKTLKAGDISRLAVTLHTGRTHQIRAHMASIDCPLVGDDVYGNREANRIHKARRLCLCATGLTLFSDGLLSYLRDQHFSIKAPF